MIQYLCKKVRNKKGFTLIELIVVIAILGVLAGIAVPRLANQTQAAERAAREANVRTLNGAVAMYLAQQGNSTDTLTAGEGGTNPTAVYGKLVSAGFIQANLDLGDITYDTTDHAFK